MSRVDRTLLHACKSLEELHHHSCIAKPEAQTDRHHAVFAMRETALGFKYNARVDKFLGWLVGVSEAGPSQRPLRAPASR